MNLKDLIVADAEAVFLNTDEFADDLTLTKPSGTQAAMTVNQRFGLLGRRPLPDGALSEFDRMQLLGRYRIGEGAASGPVTSAIVGIVERDIEDELQGSTIESADGRRVIRMARLHVLETTEITTDDQAKNCDTVTYQGQVWQCLRVEGRDDGLATIVLRCDEVISTIRGRKRP